ncbi:MAG TPA: SLC13 family permease [Bacteroidales bacterium]
MLTLPGIVVLIVIAFIILSLYLNIIGSGFTFTIGIIALGFAGILTPKEILAGFANEQIAVIVMLIIIADIIRKSGALDTMFRRAFDKATTYRQFLGRMTLMVASFSSFVNNTPLVAIMMPFVSEWSKKNGVSISKLLIPLSYAAILGGCITLIGTSTNLVVNSLVIDQQIIPGLEPLGIFDFTLVGFPMMVIGLVYLLLFGYKILPATKDNIQEISTNSREYIAEVRVIKKSNVEGKTIEEAGLRNLKGLFLVEIVREGGSIAPVTPKTKLLADDVLMFAGNTATISEFVTSKKGLQLAQIGMFSKKDHTEVVEVVVPYNSTLVSKSVKETNFRRKFDAAIIAVHRNGERISGKIGEVRLKAGDALLLITGEDFAKSASESSDLYLINSVKEIQSNPWYKNLAMIGGLLAAIVIASTGLVSLFISLISLIIILVLLGYASPKDIAKGVDFNLVIVIALSLALGTAMVKTGVADVISHYTFEMLAPMGIVGIFTGIFLLTNLLGSIITNKAAVAIVLPIALTLSINFGLNPKPFVLLVAFAGAASFLTPIGYQTNLMVYGPGRYTFKDFFRIGLPLTILYMIVAVLLLIWQFGIRLN